MSIFTKSRNAGRLTTITASLAVLLVTFFASCSGSSSGGSNSLQLVSQTGMASEGTRGEELPTQSHGFAVRNSGGQPLDWELEIDADWLHVPSQEGTLAAGAELYIPVELVESEILNLEATLHRGTVLFHENGSADDGLSVVFNLMLLPRPAEFSIVAAPDFRPVGTEDGSFFPRRTTWSFENSGDMTLAWTFDSSEEWLDIEGPMSGLLAPNSALDLNLKVDEYLATTVGLGEHTAQVRLIDAATGETALEQTIVLRVTSGFFMDNGWSILRGSPGSRIVFVSDSLGDDANDGLTLYTAKKTIAAGKSLMRHGEPDYLLLRRGDVFSESLGQWKTAGRSINEPQVVSTYGPQTDRPILRTGSSPGLVTHGGGGSPAHIDNVAFIGLHFLADTHNGTGQPTGISLHQPSENILIEDCKVERYNTGMVIQAIGGRHGNVRVRRSVVVDSFGVNDGNPQGLYCVNTDGFLIEECVFDTNGWQPTVSGATADVFSHNIYIDTANSDVTVRGNIIANGASHGVQMRSGGVCHNNLFARNSIALMMAGGSGPEQDTAHAVLNVIIDGKDIDTANPRGWGIDFNDVVGGELRRNLIANNPNGHAPIPVTLDGGGFGNGVHNVTVLNNIVWNWGGSMLFTGDVSQLTNIDFLSNQVQNSVDGSFLVNHFTSTNHASLNSAGNKFFNDVATPDSWMHQAGLFQSVPQWKQAVGDSSSTIGRSNFVDPDRLLADYSAFLGGVDSHDGFMDEVRKQSRVYWRRRYTAYAVNHWLREGF